MHNNMTDAGFRQITAPGHHSLTTQIFDRRDAHLENDAVFAVKDSLIVDFVPRDGDPNAKFELQYDFRLAQSN
jgi:catechol 1,2-dioxygenase